MSYGGADMMKKLLLLPFALVAISFEAVAMITSGWLGELYPRLKICVSFLVACAPLVLFALEGELLTPIRADDQGAEVVGLRCLAYRKTFVPTLAGASTDLTPSQFH